MGSEVIAPTLAGYLSLHTRNAETILPDHDQALKLETK